MVFEVNAEEQANLPAEVKNWNPIQYKVGDKLYTKVVSSVWFY